MKKHIKLLLRTLLSNNACVEAARTPETKYNIIAIIFVLFGLFFAAMPACVTGFQQQGGAWIRGTTYSYETAMMDFGNVAQETGLTFTIDDKHTLTPNDSWWKEEFQDPKFTNLHRFISWSKDEPDPEIEGNRKLLEIYVCSADKNYNKYVSNIMNNINPESDGEDVEGNWLESEEVEDPKTHEIKPAKKARTTSFIVFGNKKIIGALYQPTTPTIASSVSGDYHHIKKGTEVISTLYRANNPKETIKMSAKFFDKVYIDTRLANTWRSTGIILAVDSGVVILMGFMVWVLTRGKNNPFRIYTLWDGQKIAYYACLTPGILALFGFLLKNMAMMFFILFTGIRVMWLTMRTLRYQAPTQH